MKVLIADQEKGERNAVLSLLALTNCEVVVAEDGSGALKCALDMTEPYIAIFNGATPLLNGLQLCRSLRSHKLKLRPYLIVLGDKTGKQDIANALDAGADDYVTKPFSPEELLARIRAAARIQQHQIDLQREIGLRDSLAKRYDLLGEMMAQQGQNRAAKPLVPDIPDEVASSSGVTVAPAAKKPAPIDLSLQEADDIMQRIIRELHFGKVGALAKVLGSVYGKSELTTWAGFILEREQIWFDLLLEVDAAAMAMIFEQTMGRPPNSDQERRDFLVETHTVVSAGFKAALSGKGAHILTPILSRVLPSKSSPMPVSTIRESYRYALAGGSIALTVLRHKCPLRLKSTRSLQAFDITAEDVNASQATDMAWLSKGSVLTDRFIEKLAALDEGKEEKLRVPVFECSPLVNHFLT